MNSTLYIVFENINIDEIFIESPAFIPRKGDKINLLFTGLKLEQEDEPLSQDKIEEFYDTLSDINIIVDDVIHTFHNPGQSVHIFVNAYDEENLRKNIVI